jgi:SAM-dependent methyltransferase
VARALERLPRRASYGRKVLEDVILPAVRDRPGTRRILFVGCSHRTRDYGDRFPDVEFWTLDVDPETARYGSKLHITDSMTRIGEHFEPASLDAIVCVGVLGWGLDARGEIEAAISGCARCLRPGGLLVLGWNDVDEYRPPWTGIGDFPEFEATVLPPFACSRYPTFSELRLVFEFALRR